MAIERSHDIGKALVLVFGALFVVPATFSYYVLSSALREQAICHIGPLDVETTEWDNMATFTKKRETLMNLYGSYTTFDDASYYFVKTPYEIAPQVLPDYGYWSVSTLAFTLLSPKMRQSRQEEWKTRENTFDVVTAPSIQWDQSHEFDLDAAKVAPHTHSSKANRWCLVSHQDPNKFHNKQSSLELAQKEPAEPIFQKNPAKTDFDAHKFKICGPAQPSIISSGNQAPYFIELPMQAPVQGRWKKYEANSLMLSSTAASVVDDDDNVNHNKHLRTKRYGRSRPTNPYQVQVQCHVRDMDLANLAHGTLQPDSQPHMGWEHAARIELPVWNVFYLPGTLVILCTLLMVQLRRRSRNSSSRSSRRRREAVEAEEWNLVRSFQQLWFFETWSDWTAAMVWTFLVGSCLEPLVGTLPYLATTLFFSQLIAFFDEKGCNFVWVCFGQSLLLAQLEPMLTIGPIEILSFGLGDTNDALHLNILNLLIGLGPFLQLSVSPWRSAACCILSGWFLARPLAMELLGAPQWTVPMCLMSHLWWKLTQLPDHKKTDEETAALCDSDADDMSVISEQTNFSSSSAGTTTSTVNKLCSALYTGIVYAFFSAWVVLTFGCIFTLDWTLVVGGMITLWLYIGSIYFPFHPLWSLYHMTAASFLIVMITMSIAGWYLCRVAITTHALRALPPTYVYFSTGLQLVAHFGALLHTVCTKHWQTSHHVPGFYFWRKVRVVGEELRAWYYVCCRK